MLKNAKETALAIEMWIRNYFDAAGEHTKAVIGLSGGKDSSVVAALCVAAIGKDRVIGVLMPNGEQRDIADAHRVANHLGMQTVVINIASGVNSMCDAIETGLKQSPSMCRNLMNIETESKGSTLLSKDTMINLPARMRMLTLYAVAQSLQGGGRVANTCNASEDYVGYSTKYGDSAGDFSPLQHILVEEVRQLGEVLGLPYELVYKAPSDGLSGMTDEDKLGVTYEALDRYIVTGQCDQANLQAKIDRLHESNLHKLQVMPAFILDPSSRLRE